LKTQSLLASALTAIGRAVSPVCAATSDRTKGFWSDGELLLKTSLYTRHYSDDPRHNNHQRMINLEWIADDDYGPAWTDRAFAHSPRTRWLVGAAAFRNSFGQQSTMLYGGFRRELTSLGQGSTYVKLTGGLLHGYRGEFRDKIPFNQLGIAPAVLPAIGIDYRRVNLELIPFGKAGLMINIGLYPL
jgi:hypothetical protein